MENEVTLRANVGKKVGLIGIIANLLLATGKLIAGILSSSISIIADAVNNFTDGISSVVTLIGFKLAQKPADDDHPFGHARFEYVSSLIVSITVLFVGVELIKGSIEKIISPSPVEFSYLTLGILIASIIVKLALSVYNGKMADKIQSGTLKATAIDCRNDVIMTSIVLVALLVEKFFTLQVDAYMGLIVAVFIIISGINLVKETITPILGTKNDEEIKNKIINKIKDYPFVVGYHDLMIHDYGPGVSFCSIHFEVDKNDDVLHVHELIDKYERELLKEGVTITVHYDPVVTDSEELNELKKVVTKTLTNIDATLTFHDFRSIPCDGFTKVFFDVPLPCGNENLKSQIKNEVENSLNSIGSIVYSAEITFDSQSFN